MTWMLEAEAGAHGACDDFHRQRGWKGILLRFILDFLLVFTAREKQAGGKQLDFVQVTLTSEGGFELGGGLAQEELDHLQTTDHEREVDICGEDEAHEEGGEAAFANNCAWIRFRDLLQSLKVKFMVSLKEELSKVFAQPD